MKILFIEASGMGCMIMATPALAYIRDLYPKAQITVLVTSAFFAAPVEGGPLADDVVVLPFSKSKGFVGATIFTALKTLWQLRRTRFDASIVGFPSRKWQFSVLTWLIGAKKRAGHIYKGAPWYAARGWAYTHTLVANPEKHDVEQQLDLVQELFPVGHAMPRMMQFYIDPASHEEALRISRSQHFNLQPIGMHPGSSTDFGFSQKRWAPSNFAKLAHKIILEAHRPVLVFGGPDETDLLAQIKKEVNHDWLIPIQLPLKVTAALMSGCDAFVSNDSGLMHIACAVQVPTIGLFGPTNATRTRPWGKANLVIQHAAPEEVFTYPFGADDASLTRTDLMDRITVDEVYAALQEVLAARV